MNTDHIFTSYLSNNCFNLYWLRKYVDGTVSYYFQKSIKEHLNFCCKCSSIVESITTKKQRILDSKKLSHRHQPQNDITETLQSILLPDEDDLEERLYAEIINTLNSFKNDNHTLNKRKYDSKTKQYFWQTLLHYVSLITGSERTAAGIFTLNNEQLSRPLAFFNTDAITPDELASIKLYEPLNLMNRTKFITRNTDYTDVSLHVTRSELSFPIACEGRTIGIINLIDPDPYCFSKLGVVNLESKFNTFITLVVELLYHEELIWQDREQITEHAEKKSTPTRSVSILIYEKQPPAQREHVLDLYQRGLAAAEVEKYTLAITYLLTALQQVTPTSWPSLYHDAATALSNVYIALNDAHPRENAREAVYWHEKAQLVRLVRLPLISS